MDTDTPSLVLLAAGYPAAVAVLVRWLSVVRERRWTWLAVHHLGVAAIVAGQLTARRPGVAALNGAWLAVSSAWYGLGGRRSRSR